MSPEEHAGNTREARGASPLNGVVPPVEHRWRKGQSGNPGGRPKGQSITAALREALQREHNGRTVAQHLADQIIKEALRGKFPFAKEVLDRADGKVTDNHDVNISGVPPADSVLRLTDEQKVVYAIELNRLDLLSPRLQEEARKRMSMQGGTHGT
jgi:hypothetical protein